LLVNAVKHARRADAPVAIRVSLQKGADEYRLTVCDDGPGFDPRISPRRASGLGLVTGLAAQLGGRFSISRANGACCAIRFPLSLG
jgi:two-component sensor histidine kinase